jgi:hypothetical protein
MRVTELLVQYWEPDKAEGFFHTFSGWLIFVVSLVMLYLLHRVLRIMWRGPEWLDEVDDAVRPSLNCHGES